MATKTDLKRREPVEQIILRTDQVFLCLLLSRRHNHVRIVDFRTGNFPIKKDFITSIAQREGIHKAFTLVERDEVSGWQRLGFLKEGTIPGYYKRSDAFVMGKIFNENVVVQPSKQPDDKLVAVAKKLAKEMASATAHCQMRPLIQDEAMARVMRVNGRRTLTSFDPFGRHGLRLWLAVAPSKGAQENVISTEFQDCFGNARLELLFAPTSPEEQAAAILGLRTMMNELQNRGIVAAFATSRADDESLTALFLAAGFRKTGKLMGHIKDSESYVDEILWTRKLATPGEERPERLEKGGAGAGSGGASDRVEKF